MNRVIRIVSLLAVLSIVFVLFSSRIFAEEDSEALKRHVYALNKGKLTSKDWLERASACERIGVLGIPEYADDLAPLLKDTNRLVRLSAIRGIGLAGNEKYIEAICDIIVSLGRKNEDRIVATNGGWALGQIDPEKGADALLAKADGKKSSHFAVSAALGFIGGDRASKGLVKYFTTAAKDPKLMAVVVRSAGKLDTPLPIKALLKILKNKKTPLALNLAIISTFRKRKTADVISALLKKFGGSLSKQKDLLVANAAAWAVAEIGMSSKQVAKMMQLGVKGKDSTKLVVCKALLMGAGEEGSKYIGPFFKSRSYHVRMAACNVLMNYPSPKVNKVLTKVLNSDRSRFVRWSAAIALGYARDKGINEQLAGMAKNTNNKQEAARVLEALTIANDSGSVKDLVELIKGISPDEEEIVLLAGMAIASIDVNNGGNELVGLLNDGDASVRLKAVKALRFFRTSLVVKVLIDNLEREFGRMKPKDLAVYRTAVLSSLERISGHRFKPERAIWLKWWEFYLKIQKKRDAAEKAKKDLKNERRKDHTESVKFFGGSGKSEAAVEIGLHWLARYQSSEGNWDGIGYSELGDFSGDVPPMDAYLVGMTGLSLLSFSTAGYTHRTGKYMDTYERGLEWLLIKQLSSGGWQTQQNDRHGDGGVYEHATGLMALLEAFTMTGDDSLKKSCQIGVDFIAAHQNILYGWRYFHMAEDNDSSVTGWFVLALKTARVDGFRVFEKCFEGSMRWYDKVSQVMTEFEDLDLREVKYYEEYTQKFYHKCAAGYTDSAPLPSMTAINLISRRFMGFKRTHPLVRGYANYLQDWKVSFNQPTGALNLNFAFYFIYYASLANFQMGANYWKDWNEKLLDKVLSVQETDITSDFHGSWGAGKSSKGVEVSSATGCIRGGRIYATTLMILTLEIYYRYNPMLEENEITIE